MPRLLPRLALGTALTAVGSAAITQVQRGRAQRHELPGRDHVAFAPDGTRLHVVHRGPANATTVFVLVHGWAMGSVFWEDVADALADDHLVVAYDQRGHGRSGAPGTAGAEVAALGDDLQAVLETVPGDREVVLVGHSMGAMSVVAWAAHHADERVVAAALFNTGVHGLVAASAATFGRVARPIQPVLRTILTSGLPLGALPALTLRGPIAYVAHGPGADRCAVDRTAMLVCGSQARVRGAFGRSMSTMDLREALRRLEVPTCVVTGSHDRMTPPPLARALADGLPDAVLHTMEGAGHQAPLEDPRRAVSVVLDHLDAVAQRRRAAA